MQLFEVFQTYIKNIFYIALVYTMYFFFIVFCILPLCLKFIEQKQKKNFMFKVN